MQDERPPGAVGTADRADRVPPALRTTASWAWRVLLIGLVVYATLQIALRLGTLVMTLLAALLVTALLRPAADWLDRHGLPRLAAAWLVLLSLIAAAVALGTFVQQSVVDQVPLLRANLASGIERLRQLLVDRFGLAPEQLNDFVDSIIAQVVGVGGGGGPGAVVSGATTALSLLAALALALFTAFWLIYDGDRTWRFFVRLSPRAYRGVVDEAGQRAWKTLGGYLRGVTLVALMDALGIGIALVLIGVPLPFALALLTFLGAYVPVVGATVAGMVAVLVALAANGVTDALLTLGAVIVVQQVEGQLLQPLIMGRSLELHPLAITWALAIGAVLYGIAGAIIAVPLAAAIYAVGAYLAGRDAEAEQEPAVRERLRQLRRASSRKIGSRKDDAD